MTQDARRRTHDAGKKKTEGASGRKGEGGKDARRKTHDAGKKKTEGEKGRKGEGGKDARHKTQDARRREEFEKVEGVEGVEDPPLRNSADFHLRYSARKRISTSNEQPATSN